MTRKLQLTSAWQFAFYFFWMVRRDKFHPKPNSLKWPILRYEKTTILL